MGPAATPKDRAAHNWATALQTYRASLELYRRVLDIQARRDLRLADSDHNHARRPPLASNGHATGQAAPPRPAPELAPVAALQDLTPREREVAALIARGYTNQQIAEALVVTRGTAANHVAHILAKLGRANRTQVAAVVLEGAPPGQPQTA